MSLCNGVLLHLKYIHLLWKISCQYSIENYDYSTWFKWVFCCTRLKLSGSGFFKTIGLNKICRTPLCYWWWFWKERFTEDSCCQKWTLRSCLSAVIKLGGSEMSLSLMTSAVNIEQADHAYLLRVIGLCGSDKSLFSIEDLKVNRERINRPWQSKHNIVFCYQQN